MSPTHKQCSEKNRRAGFFSAVCVSEMNLVPMAVKNVLLAAGLAYYLSAYCAFYKKGGDLENEIGAENSNATKIAAD